MLDENLPTYVLKPSTDKPKQNQIFYHSHHGSDWEPNYAVRHPDSELADAKNRYAAALYDAFNPEVLYGEVLLIPEWTLPTLSAEAIRQNGGVPPPPEPILPLQFTLQLYNPDQPVTFRHKPATWNSAATWEFEMPEQTFRAPSASALDRSKHDPFASDIAPKITFKWKRDGKLSKDLVCFVSGRASNPDGSKNKHKEPDITVAMFHNLKEVTFYEPNLQRIEMEDMKGLEVVILLGAAVIRDVYFKQINETFNINESARKNSTGNILNFSVAGSPISLSPIRPATVLQREPRVPPTDPRSQWEIDVETARLQKLAAEEEKQRRKREEAEQKQIKKMLEVEEKERIRKEAEINKETERLRKLYGRQDSYPPAKPTRQQRQSVPSVTPPNNYSSPPIQPNTWGAYSNGPYMSGAAASSNFLVPGPQPGQQVKNKSSIFSFGRHSDQETNKLSKKKSAIF